jgi:hypothetical protein
MSRHTGQDILRRAARAAMICTACCHAPARPNRAECGACAVETNERKRKRKAKLSGNEPGHHRPDPITGEIEFVSAADLAAEKGPRCACGLLLPCHDHETLTIDHWASRRV